MGLLDEAIREHLELKRRRGGDPTEIARDEREALAPVFPDPDSAEPDGSEGGDSEQPAPPAAEPDPGFPEEHRAGPPGADESFSSVGEETAELDMQAVLDADGSAGHGPAEPDPGQERLSFE
jgi:hypothetical protein